MNLTNIICSFYLLHLVFIDVLSRGIELGWENWQSLVFSIGVTVALVIGLQLKEE